jgi:ribosome-binding factor A
VDPGGVARGDLVSGASAGRKAKVEQALRETLAELIAREVKDPRVRAAGLLSVTRVECNVDLSVANVYVSMYGGKDDAVDAAVAGLGRAAGFLRGPTGRALNLRHPPELRFLRDRSAEVGLDLAAIIREDEAKARAAGRVPGEPPPEPRKPRDPHDADDTTTEREPTKVLDEEPTADLHPAIPAPDDVDPDVTDESSLEEDEP